MGNIYDRLAAYIQKDRISFAMPGHKGGRGFSEDFKNNIARFDVTELADTENLHSPKGDLKKSIEGLAKRFGAKESFYLTGGSTEGVQIMLFSAVKGGKVLTNRNCHRSVVNTAVLAGFDLCFLKQATDSNIIVPMPPTADEAERAIMMNESVTACIITSPDYYGHIADIEGIARVCHKYKIPLLVDEAHGAPLSADGMIGGSIRMGADMSVQSAHKTLNALNQAAYLHWSSDLIDIDTVREMSKMVGTSSPSYPIVVSAEMALSGLSGSNWRELADYLDEKRAELSSKTEIQYPQGNIDRTRLVFGFLRYEITGHRVEEILCRCYNIDVEMADKYNVVCIVTPTNTKDEIDLLFSAVAEIIENVSKRKEECCLDLPASERAMTPKEAFFANSECVLLKDAQGRTAQTNITAYPPGIAIVAVGETISQEIIDYILKIQALGASVDGLENGKYIKVVE